MELTFKEELKEELKGLKRVKEIMRCENVFIDEEYNEIISMLRKLESILSVLKD